MSDLLDESIRHKERDRRQKHRAHAGRQNLGIFRQTMRLDFLDKSRNSELVSGMQFQPFGPQQKAAFGDDPVADL